jgi:hypothetical protein
MPLLMIFAAAAVAVAAPLQEQQEEATATTRSDDSATEHWCGEFDYSGFATKASLNISIGGGDTANISMVWDRKAHGCKHCCAESEVGLKVTRSSSGIAFLGNGSTADYYSFDAALNAAGDEMVGNITTGGRTYGTFAAQKVGCPAIVACTPGKPPPSPPHPGPPHPPPPPPPPAPPPPPHAPVPVWPLPLALTCTKAPGGAPPTALLSSSVTVALTGSGASSPVAVQAAARYQLLLQAAGAAAGPVKEIAVEVEAANDTLGQLTNYSYSLRHDSGSSSTVAASAASPFGFAYAMETLLQLAAQSSCGGGFSVVDAPVYTHRGLLLDTGRRFYPLPLLQSTIDAMAIFKMNVLHLHLNEKRFRVESKIFPLLNQPQGCSECGFYTQNDITQLVAFAKFRGVRVIPEFELSAHADALCTAWKDDGVPACCHGVYTAQLPNDASGNTSRLVGQLLTEMAGLFPDPVLHIGGDEARYQPGAVGPCTINATQRLQESTMRQLLSLGKQPMGWQEILLQTGAAASFPSAIIDTWSKAGTWVEVAATAQLRSVVSLPSSLYLDGSVTSAGATVRGGYRAGVWFDISAGALNASNKPLLLGGETSMWSDQYFPGRKGLAPCLLPSPAQDAGFAKSVSATIWPRAAIAAGSFWRWDETLSPKVQPELFASVVASVNRILMQRGIQTCPCANATSNGCDVGTYCGAKWCNATVESAALVNNSGASSSAAFAPGTTTSASTRDSIL